MSEPSSSATGSTFWELEAELDPAAEETWSLFCFEQGAAGSEWREESPARLRIAYFFDQLNERDPETWLRGFRGAYPGSLAPAAVRIVERRREPWDTAWHRYFAPLPAGHGFLVCPPWDRDGDLAGQAGRRRLVIEPGQGFGTGRHATTQLVLELIEEHLANGGPSAPKPASILDVGTGSGILALAARMLGVPKALALDIDGVVLPEVRKNFALNGLAADPAGGLECVQGGPEAVQGEWPLVVANLVTPVLLDCAEALSARVAPQGTLILSGILEVEQDQIARAYVERGLTLCEVRARDEWVACRFVKGR
jgi:ribosomal protein L11 methyltransferase